MLVSDVRKMFDKEECLFQLYDTLFDTIANRVVVIYFSFF